MSYQLVESRHQTIIATTDALTGAITPLIIATETVTINPLTGTRTYTIVNGMVLKADGRLTKPEATNPCRSCHATISSTATKTCSACMATVCAACAGDPALCTHCRRRERLRRFWEWLTTL
jgi:hypothetical protein